MMLLWLPEIAHSHGFGRLYNLPVPFWLYAWAASAVLVVSFAVVAVLKSWPAAAGPPAQMPTADARWAAQLRRARILPLLQGLSVLALGLCIATGFFGSRDPYRNFGMTFFWVVFALGFAYLAAVIGDLYAAINPWRVLTAGLGRVWRGYLAGRVRYPRRLGDWPALAFYLGFIWLELFSHGTPRALATMLAAYTALNVVGVGLVGAQAWFRHCEFFAVLLRLLALMAPLDYCPATSPGGHGTLRWRPPFAGLVRERPERVSSVVFALFMLASTAFDGLRATQWWVGLFWSDTGLAAALVDGPPVQAYGELRAWYLGWETLWLIASPFIYFGVYSACVALAHWLARSRRPLSELLLEFGYTLLPIALVYHVTHYATLLLSQGPKIVSLLSDPFGWGWNLFGTAGLWRAPILPDLGVVWHAQVGLILFGHVVSVVLAHVVALRVFPRRRDAIVSQVPMLVLMVSFTVAGLWILAQPLTEFKLR